MTFETFKTIFDKLPNCLTQVAFGVDSECKTNPDLWKILQYTRDNGIVPNLTCANIDRETAEKLSKVCGAVAISRYADKNVCYDSVKLLSQDFNMSQCNIHMLVSESTYDQVLETIEDIKTDPRLSKLRALVLLSLKQKGRGVTQKPLSQEKYKNIVNKCLEAKINFGMDSCGCFKFVNSLADNDKTKYEKYTTSCESLLESFYINVDGMGYPCSFTENEPVLPFNLNVVTCKDFVKDIWLSEPMKQVRGRILAARENKINCFFHEV
jgi:hypothetical protein